MAPVISSFLSSSHFSFFKHFLQPSITTRKVPFKLVLCGWNPMKFMQWLTSGGCPRPTGHNIGLLSHICAIFNAHRFFSSEFFSNIRISCSCFPVATFTAYYLVIQLPSNTCCRKQNLFLPGAQNWLFMLVVLLCT